MLAALLLGQQLDATARLTSPSVRCLRAASETRITFSVVAAATYCVEHETIQQAAKVQSVGYARRAATQGEGCMDLDKMRDKKSQDGPAETAIMREKFARLQNSPFA